MPTEYDSEKMKNPNNIVLLLVCRIDSDAILHTSSPQFFYDTEKKIDICDWEKFHHLGMLATLSAYEKKGRI